MGIKRHRQTDDDDDDDDDDDGHTLNLYYYLTYMGICIGLNPPKSERENYPNRN